MSASTSRSPRAELVERVLHPPGRDELTHQGGIHDGAALHDPLQRLRELRDVGDPALQQIAAALAAREQLHCVLDLDVGREDDHADLRKLLLDGVRRDEAFGRVRRRHPDVDEREVRMVLADEGEELRGVAGLADDDEVGALEQAGEPFAQ